MLLLKRHSFLELEIDKSGNLHYDYNVNGEDEDE